LNAALSAAFRDGHSLGSALRTALAVLCVGASFGSVSRAGLTTALSVGHLRAAFSATLGVGNSLGSALRADLAAALASAIARQRSACRPRRRLGRQP
tara:strand:- start:1161 stop:1451 length:291 start_codon:yes stop_codon:yes gene_type:complete